MDLINLFPIVRNVELWLSVEGAEGTLQEGGFPSHSDVLARQTPQPASPGRSSSLPWQQLPACSWQFCNRVPPASCFPVNGFPLHPRGKISSKFHYHGTTVMFLLSSEPWLCTAEEASSNQADKMIHFVDISSWDYRCMPQSLAASLYLKLLMGIIWD